MGRGEKKEKKEKGRDRSANDVLTFEETESSTMFDGAETVSPNENE